MGIAASTAILPPPAAAVVLRALMSARHALILYNGSWILLRDGLPSDGPVKLDCAKLFDLLRHARAVIVGAERTELTSESVAEIASALVSARQALDFYEGAVVMSDGPDGQTSLHFGMAPTYISEALTALGVAQS